MTEPGRCLVCGVAHAACGTPSTGPAIDLPARTEGTEMTEQGERERRWVNHGTERRPAWGLYEMTPADRRYPSSLPWVPGERPGGKPGLVESEQPETPLADNKAVVPAPVRAPRKQTKRKADQP